MLGQNKVVIIAAMIALMATMTTMTQGQNVFASSDKIVDNQHEHQTCTDNGGALTCSGNAGETVNTKDPNVPFTHSNTNCNSHRSGDVCKQNTH